MENERSRLAKINSIYKNAQRGALAKMLVMFIAVGLYIFSTLLAAGSFNLIEILLSAAAFLMLISVSSIDLFFERQKAKENAESLVRLDTHNDNIISLQEKYRELDQKHNEQMSKILVEQEKIKTELSSVRQLLEKEKQENEVEQKSLNNVNCLYDC